MVSQPPHPHLHNVIRRASDDTDTDEFQRFLQVRVALFVRTMMVLFTALYVGGAVMIALFAPTWFVAVHVHPAKILNGALALGLFGVWTFMRRGTHNLGVLRAVDFVTVFAIAICASVGVATAPSGYFLELGGLLILVVVLILRSAIVPSTAGFTLAVGFACVPLIVTGSYLQANTHAQRGFASPQLVAMGIGIWCVVTTLTAGMVSREIYGLVAQVRRAMQLGRYTLREKIGEGGMGAVYRAEHAMLRRKTAIKLLLPDRVSAEALVRFEREVQLTSQLSHPNTIAIHDYGRTPHGVFYYAMEFLTGKSLEKLVEEEGPQPPGRVVHMLLQIAGSLREAHAAGLIHRDIKPSNLLIGEHGGMLDFVKVIDFGLVKQLDPGESPAVSRTDSIAGTPLFMAPECVTRPESIDSKVDTYALGATAYYLLTGMPVFEGRSLVEVCGHHLHSVPQPPSRRMNAPAPPRLEALILRCLAKEPENRPDDDELLAALQECERESPWGAVTPSSMSARHSARSTAVH
jgi:eukaryotic-like serine/threonine-protein kinase